MGSLRIQPNIGEHRYFIAFERQLVRVDSTVVAFPPRAKIQQTNGTGDDDSCEAHLVAYGVLHAPDLGLIERGMRGRLELRVLAREHA